MFIVFKEDTIRRFIWVCQFEIYDNHVFETRLGVNWSCLDTSTVATPRGSIQHHAKQSTPIHSQLVILICITFRSPSWWSLHREDFDHLVITYSTLVHHTVSSKWLIGHTHCSLTSASKVSTLSMFTMARALVFVTLSSNK